MLSFRVIRCELASAYRRFCLIINLFEKGDPSISRDNVESAMRTVDYMNLVIDMLDETSKMILRKKLIENADRNWYYEFFSKKSYERAAKKAYNLYVSELNNR